jgi:hypothetical protein
MPPTIPPTAVVQLPELAWPAWQATNVTLHLWTQIVGKIRLTLTPWTNHSWHTTLYVTARGLTTSTIPHENGSFQIDFDFSDHVLLIQKNGGALRSVELKPRSVADFYQALMQALEQLDLHVKIHRKPNELPDPIAFDQDTVHRSYDPDAVQRLHAILLFSHRVFTDFRTAFLGKVSPVHSTWLSRVSLDDARHCMQAVSPISLIPWRRKRTPMKSAARASGPATRACRIPSIIRMRIPSLRAFAMRSCNPRQLFSTLTLVSSFFRTMPCALPPIRQLR